MNMRACIIIQELRLSYVSVLKYLEHQELPDFRMTLLEALSYCGFFESLPFCNLCRIHKLSVIKH